MHSGGSNRFVVWDDRRGPNFVRGLCVFVYASGERTWFVRVPAPNTRARYRYVRLGYVDQVNAERARAMATKAWDDVRLQRPVRVTDAPMTVSEACKRFLAEYRTKGKGRAIAESAAWQANLRRLRDAIGSRALESVVGADLQKIANRLTAATGRVCRSNWSCLWEHAQSERWIPADLPNPARRVTTRHLVVTVGKRKKYLRAEQIHACIAAASGRGILPHYIRVLALTGHRPGELLRARWEDVTDGRVTVIETKKERTITLPPVSSPELRAALEDLRAVTGRMGGLFGPHTDPQRADKQYRALAARWDRLVDKRPELAGINLSHFRSTVATEAYREAHAVALAAAQHRLQHMDDYVTEENYVVM